ncbi:MAG: cytochrome c oxidase assembly protein [Candidatus Acidiferrales bacterium]
MTPDAAAILSAWSPPIAVNATIALAVVVYVRGWFRIRRSFPNLIPAGRLATFLGGMFALWVAIGSPLEAFDDLSLTMHMVQHLLLMVAAPPLVLLGEPLLPLLRGLPGWMVRGGAGPLLRWGPVRRLAHFLTEPAFCWLIAAVALIGWHVPSAFELALRSDGWHEVEHGCFFATSLLFWWPVVLPFPSDARWPRWSIPLYLFLGMLPGGALGAFLIFCDRVLYPSYAAAPALFRMTPFDDQVIAGALMWIFGSIVYLIPAVLITVKMLSPARADYPRGARFASGAIAER